MICCYVTLKVPKMSDSHFGLGHYRLEIDKNAAKTSKGARDHH